MILDWTSMIQYDFRLDHRLDQYTYTGPIRTPVKVPV